MAPYTSATRLAVSLSLARSLVVFGTLQTSLQRVKRPSARGMKFHRTLEGMGSSKKRRRDLERQKYPRRPRVRSLLRVLKHWRRWDFLCLQRFPNAFLLFIRNFHESVAFKRMYRIRAVYVVAENDEKVLASHFLPFHFYFIFYSLKLRIKLVFKN